MNNRGQVYLIAALILSVALFLLISQTNIVQRILFEDDFEQLSKNFDVESIKFMNNLLSQDSGPEISEVITKFTQFTVKFTDYANIENPEFEFVYVLDYQGNPITGYYIKTEDISFEPNLDLDSQIGEASIEIEETTLSMPSTGESKVIEARIESVLIGDFRYKLNLISGVPQMVIISREARGNQTKVYLNEEFITGERI